MPLMINTSPSNNQQFVSGFIQGNNNTYDFTSKFNDHPIGVFVDFQKILTNMPMQSIEDSSATKILEESKKLLQNLYSFGGEYKDDGVVMTSEINLLDKKTNSLKQLNQYFDVVYAEIKKHQATKNETDDADDVMMPVPDSSEAH